MREEKNEKIEMKTNCKTPPCVSTQKKEPKIFF